MEKWRLRSLVAFAVGLLVGAGAFVLLAFHPALACAERNQLKCLGREQDFFGAIALAMWCIATVALGLAAWAWLRSAKLNRMRPRAGYADPRAPAGAPPPGLTPPGGPVALRPPSNDARTTAPRASVPGRPEGVKRAPVDLRDARRGPR